MTYHYAAFALFVNGLDFEVGLQVAAEPVFDEQRKLLLVERTFVQETAHGGARLDDAHSLLLKGWHFAIPEDHCLLLVVGVRELDDSQRALDPVLDLRSAATYRLEPTCDLPAFVVLLEHSQDRDSFRRQLREEARVVVLGNS